ncbi:alcohol dehydrogenase, putative [Talaromyces stipitatus ATCC 10500]|uniref:Alcohol dehydrogenase, putative n=1 Tax=Talaromyces stipitatus (strain ATCC 10500 / CBS 375.48 / QM 6759 / NRRL 1006) TaxID=441959 RepID=B8MQG8_TALSN|nr:alcohol dehydrogenase, putative [Talaromyces stipitatus ATCC 10500]EED13370.1 alcohol dehydrogenase, putative [Talaromyces stipitatus ATCC 10500]
MARQWILNSQDGFEASLEYQQNVIVPSAAKLGPTEVLVKLHAASLNYRELVIAGPIGVNGPITAPIVPGCDGAGIVEAVGSSVHEFRPGDRVVTYAVPKLAESDGDDAFSSVTDVPYMMGQGIDGTLRSMGVFPEKGLVHAPKSLDWLPAATLTCNWTTAWNALFGLKGREAGPGTWVLVQGTGGVSIATLQVAVAAGATVVATTSTEEKAARLRKLGAAHTINYRSNPDDWALQAKRLTPGGRGFDIVVDVGGNETLRQSLAAIRVDGQVLVLGAVGGTAENVPLFAVLLSTCIVRGFLCGSRRQLKEVIQFIDEKNITPAMDDVVFELAEAKDAYRRLKEKKHFAKVLIRIDHF